MAIFTIIAGAIGSAIGLTGLGLAIFKAVTTFALAVTASRLLAKRQMKKLKKAMQGQGGGRVQLPPATDNKIPIVYGTAFVSGPVVDAKISTDQKTMWYVVALAEHSDTTENADIQFNIDKVYYDGKRVRFLHGASPLVTGLINESVTPPQLDEKASSKIWIYLYKNGSHSPQNTTQTAIEVLQDAKIAPADRWTATDLMTNSAFAVIRVDYDTEAGTVSLGALQVELTNNINRPGDVFRDYMLNPRYGCAIPPSQIDFDSLTAINLYSDELIEYKPIGWTTGQPYAQKPRYRINGILDTADTCLDNLQMIADACDCWLQYNELKGQWSVVPNRSYTDYTTINNLFVVDDDNLVGGIDITPINLTETYNKLEVGYPCNKLRDQVDFRIVKLEDYQDVVMSPNEPVNNFDLSLWMVNEPVQAQYIGVRRLLQSREDLTISFRTDYSGIRITAGDVIRVKHNEYGWDLMNDNQGKLFRVAQVIEEKRGDGTLGTMVKAFEYNDTVYSDFALQDFELEDNIGVSDPNIIDKPQPPTVRLVPLGDFYAMEVRGVVPERGLVRYMSFNYGTDPDSATHRYYTTATNASGEPLLPGEVMTIDAVQIPRDTIYWSVTAKNDAVGIRSESSEPIDWPGAEVPVYSETEFCGVNSSGVLFTSDDPYPEEEVKIGGIVEITSGTGELQERTRVVELISETEFTVDKEPIVGLEDACIKVTAGGIGEDQLIPTTVEPGVYNVFVPGANNTPTGSQALSTITIGEDGRVYSAVTTSVGDIGGNVIITGDMIANNTITANNIANFTITSNQLSNTGVIPGTYTNATITVLADGRLTFAQTGTSGGTGSGIYAWGGAQGTSLTTFWPEIGQAQNLAQPLGIPPGWGLDSFTDWITLDQNVSYDWYTGTSTTGRQFIQNSSARYQPLGAGLQDITSRPSIPLGGYEGWWAVTSSNIPISQQFANWRYECTSSVQLYASELFITEQPRVLFAEVCGFAVGFNPSNATATGQIRVAHTMTRNMLPVLEPTTMHLNWSIKSTATRRISAMGMCVRILSYDINDFSWSPIQRTSGSPSSTPGPQVAMISGRTAVKSPIDINAVPDSQMNADHLFGLNLP